MTSTSKTKYILNK